MLFTSPFYFALLRWTTMDRGGPWWPIVAREAPFALRHPFTSSGFSKASKSSDTPPPPSFLSFPSFPRVNQIRTKNPLLGNPTTPPFPDPILPTIPSLVPAVSSVGFDGKSFCEDVCSVFRGFGIVLVDDIFLPEISRVLQADAKTLCCYCSIRSPEQRAGEWRTGEARR